MNNILNPTWTWLLSHQLSIQYLSSDNTCTNLFERMSSILVSWKKWLITMISHESIHQQIFRLVECGIIFMTVVETAQVWIGKWMSRTMTIIAEPYFLIADSNIISLATKLEVWCFLNLPMVIFFVCVAMKNFGKIIVQTIIIGTRYLFLKRITKTLWRYTVLPFSIKTNF